MARLAHDARQGGCLVSRRIETRANGLPGTRYFDLAPTAGGEPYRIFLFTPKGEPPAEGWPLLVMTDGNATFPFAFASLVTQAPFPIGTNVGWGLVAAIGYPTNVSPVLSR